jgi:hypothetical protein
LNDKKLERDTEAEYQLAKQEIETINKLEKEKGIKDAYYGAPEYWENRYKQNEGGTFSEWINGWEDMKDIIE